MVMDYSRRWWLRIMVWEYSWGSWLSEKILNELNLTSHLKLRIDCIWVLLNKRFFTIEKSEMTWAKIWSTFPIFMCCSCRCNIRNSVNTKTFANFTFETWIITDCHHFFVSLVLNSWNHKGPRGECEQQIKFLIHCRPISWKKGGLWRFSHKQDFIRSFQLYIWNIVWTACAYAKFAKSVSLVVKWVAIQGRLQRKH
jgi:hypothetical protein